MGLKALKTDTNLEQKGIVVDYGDFRVTVARAGGANEDFKKEITRLYTPVQKLHELKLLADDVAEKIYIEAYVNAVIMNWETLYEGEWQQGIDFGDGLVPFNRENVTKALTEYPDVFREIKDESMDAARYRVAQREEAAKN